MRGLWWCIFLCSVGLLLHAPRGDVVEAQAKRLEEGFSVGQRPPAFSVEDLDGRAYTLGRYRGKILVLHFWASWCPHCRGEIPELKELHHRWRSKDVRVLAVSIDYDVSTLRAFVAHAALPYPVVADQASQLALSSRYGVRGIPVTFIIGPDSHIAVRLDGSADILGAVQQVLASRAPPAT